MITAPKLQQLANDNDIAKNLRDVFPHPYTLDNAVEFLKLNEQGIIQHTFAILNADTFIGVGSIVPQKDVHRLNGEIGYWIGKPYWGKGFATQAVIQLTRYAFNELHLSRVYAGVFESNPASMRVLEKAGYTLEAVIHSSIVKAGTIQNEHLYSIRKNQ